MNTSKKISWGVDNMIYALSVIFTLGMTYILKIVIMKAIVESREIKWH